MRCSTLAEEAAEFAMAAGYVLDVHAAPYMKAPVITLRRDPGAVPDLLGMVDALVDSQYFVDGSGIALGVDLEPFFDAVHGANMGKVWCAADLLKMEPGWTSQRVEGTIFFIVRREDGKVMKPPGFKPADLNQVLSAQIESKCLQISESEVNEAVPADDLNPELP